MKTTKKLASLFFALVMVFSLCASAGATNAQTATLTVSYCSELLLNESISTTAGMTAKDAVDLFADVLKVEWAALNYSCSSTTDYVIDTILGVSNEPVGADSGIQAEFWSTTYPGYGIEYVENANGETVYHYIYVGYEWSFAANGVVPENCTQVGDRFFPEYLLNRYTVQPGDSLEISYDLTIHRWTDTSFWLTN